MRTNSLGPLAPLLKNLALAYLLLPVVMFLALWLRPEFGIPALLAVGFSVQHCRASNLSAKLSPQLTAHQPTVISPLVTWQHGAILLYCLVLSLLFCLWTIPTPSALPFWDYAKHDVVLHNLVDYPWPVTYFTETDGATVLRYSLAYYLPAALLAKWVGAKWAQVSLFGWTVVGVWLFFSFVASRARRWPFALLAVPLAALFAGLDVLAYWGVNGSLQDFGSALVNAWSRPYSCGWLIASTPFSFRFTPQHALPSSIGAMLLLDTWHSERFWRYCSLAALALLLWSPFVALSFGAVALARISSRDFGPQLRALIVSGNLALLPVFAILALYILASSRGIPMIMCPAGNDVAQFVGRYFLFCVLEFGLLCALLLRMQVGMTRPVLASLLVLCALMLTWVGTSNDLQMRGSNLPMVLLLLVALQALQESGQFWLRAGLLATLLLGCVTGWQELQRSGLNWQIARARLLEPVFAVNWLAHNESLNYIIAPQYLARLRQDGWPYRMLRLQPGAFRLMPVVPALTEMHWSAFGTAQFDLTTHTVQSDGLTDAALFTDALALPAGLYRIDLVMDWDKAQPEQDDATPRAVHVSILGQRKLAAFEKGTVQNFAVTLFVQFDGQPVRLAFGLGGWGRASGRVRLREGQIYGISPTLAF